MEFRLLGSVEVVEQGNGAIALGGPRQRAVLAHLLLRANNLVPTEILIDEVWGDEPPEAARNALQSYASHLRKAIGPGRLEGSRAGYVLRADPSEVDTVRFQSLLRDAQRLMPIDPKASVAVFDDALSLWRGPAFGDLAPEPSLRAEAARLDELRLGAMEDRIEALLTIGVHDQVIGELEGLTARHPLRERLWGQLILALYRAGRQAEALGAYQRAREILSDELGIDPSPDLRKLHERVLQQSPDLEIGGSPLRGYRLLERVGAGSFGTVWRAIQPEMGRDVAVKAIHPHLANDPDFIRRFEAEAQLIARLEHPHVVPLYDYWREPGAAYLVMRFLRGGSLAEALDAGPLEIERVARLIDQVSGGLAAAHRQGVVHRDVKPSNILLDDEGNAYLADFGIAKDLSLPALTEPGATKGSLVYLAPEQIRGETITPRTDVYALGVVLYEALVGEHPFGNLPDLAVYERQLREPLPSARIRRAELQPALDDVIATATAKDPGLRFPDAMALGAAVRNALSPSQMSVAAPAPYETRNPYKGLRPFDEADAQDFFGREAFVERLLQRWRRPGPRARFLAVVGPSGSGKSSVVRAGLVPALRSGRLEGSEEWFISELVPGRHPMEELEAALLRIAARPPAGLLQVLESGPRGLLQAVDRVVPEGSELVLIVDQFEEAFTLTEDESERALLLESLRVATADPASRTRIVATLRADFYDRPLNYPRFGPLLGASTEVMTPLAPDELEQAIVRPAGSVGLRVEPAVVAQVASDVAEQPGALPLVQYALTELFERRDDGTLTLAAYRDIGGVGGALAARGEQLYAARDPAGREVIRQLFLRLVTLGEGVADTRRRVPLLELSAIEVDSEGMQAAIDALGRHRLLTFDRDPGTREPTVEVAHEALLRSWPRLHEWIDGAREDVRTLRRLSDAATEWERGEREPSFLVRGSRLDQLQSWAEGTDLAVGRAELSYLRASAARRDEELASEAARRDRERLLERRAVKRLRAVVVVLAAAALVAASLTVVAGNESNRAERQSRIATARELAAASEASSAEDVDRSLLLAIRAVQTTYEADGTVIPEAERALHLAVQADRLLLTVPGAAVVRYNPDGSRILTPGLEPGTAYVYDAETGEKLLTIAGHGNEVLSHVNWSPDGRYISTSSRSARTTVVWNARTGTEVRTLAVPGWFVCCYAEFSPDGSAIVSVVFKEVHGGFRGETRVWSVETGEELRRFDLVGGTAFSPDGDQLWIDTCVYDWRTPGAAPHSLCVDPGAGVLDVSWSADGSLVGTSLDDGNIALWDPGTGNRELTLTPDATGLALDIELDPDAERLAAGFTDGVVRVWDLHGETATRSLSLSGHEGEYVQSMKFSPDGTRLVSAGGDGRVNVWDITPEGSREGWTAEGRGGFDYSSDGQRLVIAGRGRVVHVYDAETGESLETFSGLDIRPFATSFSPDTEQIAVAGLNGTVLIVDAATGRTSLTLREERGGAVWDVAFSPDGSLVAATSEADWTDVWDAATGELVRSFDSGRYSLAFSADGQLLVAQNNDVQIRRLELVPIWDVSTGETVNVVHHHDWVNAVAFSPTDDRLVTGGLDGVLRVWDASTGKIIVAMSGDLGEVWDLAFSPDGKLLASASEDGTVRIWDPDADREISTIAQTGNSNVGFDVAFSPDGSRVAATGADGAIRVFVLPIEELLDIAKARVGRSFTEQECRQYLHLERCHP